MCVCVCVCKYYLVQLNHQDKKTIQEWTFKFIYIYIYIYIYVYINISYLPTPLIGQDMTQGQFFKRRLTGFNSEFSFSYTSCLKKDEEPSLSYYLPIAGGGMIGFIPFPRVFVLCEMQSASSRIWTRIAVSISYVDNHYTN